MDDWQPIENWRYVPHGNNNILAYWETADNMPCCAVGIWDYHKKEWFEHLDHLTQRPIYPTLFKPWKLVKPNITN